MAPAMQRVALILLLFILLMDGHHSSRTLPASFDSLLVQARPISEPRAVVQAAYGPLRLLGVWQLTSAQHAFGGISSMLAGPNGQLLGLSDSGEMFSFRVNGPQHEGYIKPLPTLPGEHDWPRWKWDSESMTRDPVSGRVWVGFETIQRICRYARDFARIEGCVSPPALEAWPETGSIEAMVRFGDGRFLALSEMGPGAYGGHDALLWQGDPVDPRTPPPVHLSYMPPTGYRPTDAVWLGGDRLLVLNRRVTLAQGFTAKLVLLHLPELREGALLRGRVIASFAPPGLTDNLEALAVGREAGGPVLWIASDDNHFFLQRTLLFRFALPPDWISARPAP